MSTNLTNSAAMPANDIRVQSRRTTGIGCRVLLN